MGGRRGMRWGESAWVKQGLVGQRKETGLCSPCGGRHEEVLSKGVAWSDVERRAWGTRRALWQQGPLWGALAEVRGKLAATWRRCRQQTGTEVDGLEYVCEE